MQIEFSDYKQYLVPVIVVVIGIAGWYWLQSPNETQMPLSIQTPITESPISAVVTVYITGKVKKPGVIELPIGSRVIDAVRAAGGLTIKRPNINLARILTDGEEILVLRFNNQSSVENGKVNLNTAQISELETIPGIGPVMAEKILDFRDAKGSFQSIEDLDAISGVGPSLMAQLQESAFVD